MLNKSHSEIVCKLMKTCKLVVSVLMKSELDSNTVNGMKRICVRERESGCCHMLPSATVFFANVSLWIKFANLIRLNVFSSIKWFESVQMTIISLIHWGVFYTLELNDLSSFVTQTSTLLKFVVRLEFDFFSFHRVRQPKVLFGESL